MIDEKEVLKILKRYEGRMNPTAYFSLEADIVNIEALEQEPTTKNNLGVDLISRADAIQAMQDKAKKLTNEDTINGLCGAAAILYELPSVTPQEPKTKIEESNFSREQYVLDTDTAWKCGYEAGKKENSPVNICPHCGEYIGEEE